MGSFLRSGLMVVVAVSMMTLVACGSTDLTEIGDDTFISGDASADAAPSQFSISITPTTLTLGRGETGTFAVTVARAQGFDGVVDISVSGLPVGIVASALAIPSAATTGTLTLAASDAASIGSAAITVSGSDASGNVRSTAPAQIVIGGSAGALDTSFGSAGKFSFNVGVSADAARVVATQADGKLLVAGGIATPTAFGAFARYNANGSLDTSFGNGGKVILSAESEITALAVQTDGKILVTTDLGFHVARFNADGSADATFVRSGSVDQTFDQPYLASADSLAVQPDGKIVVVGSLYQGATAQMVVMRLNANGSNDGTFGNFGIKTIPIVGSIGSYGGSVAIVTSGATTTSILVSAYNATAASTVGFDLLVARLNGIDGSLDATFGGSGMVSAVTNAFGNTGSMVIQGDGKIVVGGTIYGSTTQGFVVVRFDTDGTLDSAFDGDGMTTIPFNDDCQLESIALQADGKIVALGTTYGGTPAFGGFAVARLSTDGSLDTTFDANGTLSFNFGVKYDRAYGIAMDANQEILVVGSSQIGNDVDFAMAKITSNGFIDESFGPSGGGKITTPIGNGDDAISASALQADGSLIVVGYAYNGTTDDMLVARVTSAGALDPTFGTGGIVTTSLGSSGYAVAIEDDGKIVVCGPNAIVRFLPNGAVDTSFGSQGVAALTYDAYAVAIHGGDIFVSGSSFGVQAFDSTGAHLESFGTSGATTGTFPTPLPIAYAMTLDGSNNFVLAGSISNANNTVNPVDFELARYTAQGAVDTTFGSNGVEEVSIAPTDYAGAIAIQADGKIIAAGLAYTTPANSDFAVERYAANGTLDTSFNGTGYVITDFDGYDQVNAVLVQPDGKIVAAGTASATEALAKFAVARYGSDGSLDATFGSSGKIMTAFGAGPDHAQTMVRRADGRLIVSGGATSAHHDLDVAIAQVWP